MENIDISWESTKNATVDATNIQPGATTSTQISVHAENAGSTFKGNLTVTSGGSNDFVAGEGFTGKVTVNGMVAGSVQADNASNVVVDSASGAKVISVSAKAAKSVTLGATNGFTQVDLVAEGSSGVTANGTAATGEIADLVLSGKTATVTTTLLDVVNITAEWPLMVQ